MSTHELRKFIDSLQFDDLENADLKELAEIIGLDKMKLVISELQGLNIYIPKLTYYKKWLKRLLKTPDINVNQLCKTLNCSKIYLLNLQRENYQQVSTKIPQALNKLKK